MKRFLSVAFVFIAGCAVTLGAEFTSTNAQAPNVEMPKTPVENVKVFYKSSPPGFTLKTNELTVEPGFSHQILGELRVTVQSGKECYAGTVNQAHVLSVLQRKAHEVGGNAVIYAHSSISQAGMPQECGDARSANDFGGGWAVIVGSQTPSETTTAPSSPPAATPPPGGP